MYGVVQTALDKLHWNSPIFQWFIFGHAGTNKNSGAEVQRPNSPPPILAKSEACSIITSVRGPIR